MVKCLFVLLELSFATVIFIPLGNSGYKKGLTFVVYSTLLFVNKTIVSLKLGMVLASGVVYCSRCSLAAQSYCCRASIFCFLLSVCSSWIWIYCACRAC